MATSTDLIGYRAIRNDLVDSCKKTGCFTEVYTKQPPSGFTGNVASIMFGAGRVDQSTSGLNVSSVRQAAFITIWSPETLEPLDDTDLETLETFSKFMYFLHTDVDFGGQIMAYNVLDIDWNPKPATLGDGKTYRTIDVIIPFTVANVWTQN